MTTMKSVPSPVSSPRPWSDTTSDEPGTISCGNLVDRRPAEFRCGRAPAAGFCGGGIGRAASRRPLSLAPAAALCRSSWLVVLGACARAFGSSPGSDTTFQRNVVRSSSEKFHRGEDVRPERLFRMLDGDRRVEQRLEILPHVNLLLLAADEDRDRRFLGHGVSDLFRRLGERHRYVRRCGGRRRHVSRRRRGRLRCWSGRCRPVSSRRPVRFSARPSGGPALARSAAGVSALAYRTSARIGLGRHPASLRRHHRGAASPLPRKPISDGFTVVAASAGGASAVLVASTLCAVFTGGADDGAGAGAAAATGGLSLCTNRCGSANSVGLSSPVAR